MKKSRWTLGRQGTGYNTLCLFKGWKFFPVDAYLIRYRVGDFIYSHTDPVSDKKHYRLNLILKKAKRGGLLLIPGHKVDGRVYFFRPDLESHSVTRVEEGTRYVLSIGVAF